MGEFGWNMKKSMANNESIHKTEHNIDLVGKKRNGKENVEELVDSKWPQDIYVRNIRGDNSEDSLKKWGTKIVTAIVKQKTRYTLKMRYLKDLTHKDDDGQDLLQPLDTILLDLDCVYLSKKRYGKAINACTFINSNQAKYFFAEYHARTTLERLLY